MKKEKELQDERKQRIEDFEKTHVKIINKALYLVELPDGNILKTSLFSPERFLGGSKPSLEPQFLKQKQEFKKNIPALVPIHIFLRYCYTHSCILHDSAL